MGPKPGLPCEGHGEAAQPAALRTAKQFKLNQKKMSVATFSPFSGFSRPFPRFPSFSEGSPVEICLFQPIIGIVSEPTSAVHLDVMFLHGAQSSSSVAGFLQNGIT